MSQGTPDSVDRGQSGFQGQYGAPAAAGSDAGVGPDPSVGAAGALLPVRAPVLTQPARRGRLPRLPRFLLGNKNSTPAAAASG